MPKAKDDLEAVRLLVEALEGFSAEQQERIIRWAREKVGLVSAPPSTQVTPSGQPQLSAPPPGPTKDLKTFVAAKGPKSDTQFAATVAYFYKFEAPLDQKKGEIDSATLQDACRLAGRHRLPSPGQTLRNAKTLGLLDSGSEAGKFALNTVGENLVAMTLPGQSATGSKSPRAAKPAEKRKRTKK